MENFTFQLNNSAGAAAPADGAFLSLGSVIFYSVFKAKNVLHSRMPKHFTGSVGKCAVDGG